jgi:hypothetical protein
MEVNLKNSASAVDGVGQIHDPQLYPREQIPSAHWIVGWPAHRAGLEAVVNRKIVPIANRSPVVQHTA